MKVIFFIFWTAAIIGVLSSAKNLQDMNILSKILIIIFLICPYIIILKPSKKPKQPTIVNYNPMPMRTPISMATLEQTVQNRKLKSNFDLNHFEKYSDLEMKLLDLETDARNERILHKKIQLLEKTIKAYDRLKKFCYSKGKGGTIYFQEEWESKPFLSDILKELEETKQEKAMIMPNIIEAISENDGILQRNIYTIFSDEVSTSDIQAILKELEANGTITRSKKGSSYELHLNKERNVMEQWNSTFNI